MYKIIVLINGITIISSVEEIISDPGNPDCKIISPYKIIGDFENFSMEKWIPFTYQDEILISSTNILTIVDPSQKILNAYLELIES